MALVDFSGEIWQAAQISAPLLKFNVCLTFCLFIFIFLPFYQVNTPFLFPKVRFLAEWIQPCHDHSYCLWEMIQLLFMFFFSSLRHAWEWSDSFYQCNEQQMFLFLVHYVWHFFVYSIWHFWTVWRSLIKHRWSLHNMSSSRLQALACTEAGARN